MKLLPGSSAAVVPIGPFPRRCPLVAAAALPALSGASASFSGRPFAAAGGESGRCRGRGAPSAAIRPPGAVFWAGLCPGAARRPARGCGLRGGLRQGPEGGADRLPAWAWTWAWPGGLGSVLGPSWVARGLGKDLWPGRRGMPRGPATPTGPAAAFSPAHVCRPRQPWRPAAMA